MRSISSTTSVAASTGKTMRISTEVSSTFQVKIGIRNIVMPGARIVRMVVTKFTAPRIVPTPPRAKPRIHRSEPMFGENSAPDSGV